jgi:hypothetical protein
LKKSLKRLGEWGEGKWQPISWDEALGREGVRFANVFGSPNITSMAHVCFHPRQNASNITYGFFRISDFSYPPGCIVVWGEWMSLL